jgi:hypothetical protein
MKHYELLRDIYRIARRNSDNATNNSTHDLTANLIVDLIERERGDEEILDKWVEMEKYPHQDNHMD